MSKRKAAGSAAFFTQTTKVLVKPDRWRQISSLAPGDTVKSVVMVNGTPTLVDRKVVDVVIRPSRWFGNWVSWVIQDYGCGGHLAGYFGSSFLVRGMVRVTDEPGVAFRTQALKEALASWAWGFDPHGDLRFIIWELGTEQQRRSEDYIGRCTSTYEKSWPSDGHIGYAVVLEKGDNYLVTPRMNTWEGFITYAVNDPSRFPESAV